MQLYDKHNSYGWISISLHWLAVGLIVTLWIIGDSANYFDVREDKIRQIRLHISIAACAYLLLWIRIGWRLKSGHPRLDGQSRLDHWIANTAHYTLLLGIATMLISGPVTVWSNGIDIKVFDWFSIPGPFDKNESLNEMASAVHVFCAKAILVVVILHICGACKHLMFNDDDIFLRILTPKKDQRPRVG